MEIIIVPHPQGWAVKGLVVQEKPDGEIEEHYREIGNLTKEDGWTQELIDQLMDLLRKLKLGV